MTVQTHFRPPAARVSGIVEESPGKLEYEVALFREATASEDVAAKGRVPVENAVPIGTKLQLRATIDTSSGKLIGRQCMKYINNRSVYICSMEIRQVDRGDHLFRPQGRVRQGAHHPHQERV